MRKYYEIVMESFFDKWVNNPADINKPQSWINGALGQDLDYILFLNRKIVESE